MGSTPKTAAKNTLRRWWSTGTNKLFKAGAVSASAFCLIGLLGMPAAPARAESIPNYAEPRAKRTVPARNIGDIIGRSILSNHKSARANIRPQNTYASVSLDHMIGQMILIGFRGQTPKSRDAATAIKAIRSGKVGGVLLMGHNIKSSRQLIQLTKSLSAVRNGQLPPFISIDQEGGVVQRLGPKQGIRKYPSAAAIAKAGDAEAAQSVYSLMAGDLAEHGVNLNFGPVVDLTVNKRNPVIVRAGRSYGKSAKLVTQYATAFINAHTNSGVLTAAKHFPGHGSSRSDSHKGFVDISKTWSERELAPYRSLIRSGKLNMIMVGHLFHNKFSKDGRHPATLSDGIINGLLRQTLGYQGVVITDDLIMAAIRKHYSLKESYIRAINAGNDILMVTSLGSSGKTVKTVHSIIKQAVKDGSISRARIEQSYRRIVRLKRRLFAMQQEVVHPRHANESEVPR